MMSLGTRWDVVLVCALTGLAVQACDFSEEPASNVEGIEIQTLLPAFDSRVDVSELVTFSWTLSEEPDGQFRYRIEYAPTLDLSEGGLHTMNGRQSGRLLKQTRIDFNPAHSPLTADVETWYWRVRVEADGSVGNWTEVSKFNVAQ